MEAIGVIPARFASSRFSGKVLKEVSGKSILQHVYERAKRASSIEELIIATDDDRIRKAAETFGAKVEMTSKDHRSGTDRLTEVVNPLDVHIVVNIQADEPMIHPSMIDTLVDTLNRDDSVVMATLKYMIKDRTQVKDPNVVKVITDRNSCAIYFSRTQIPYSKGKRRQSYFKHIGIYAYTKDFLFTFTNMPVSNLEEAEGLEQLRVLESGFKIKVIETEFDTLGVDTPEDLERLKTVFKDSL